MIPEEEIMSEIKEMGYVTIKPRVERPSYYKLSDGTIVKALVHINSIIADPRNPEGFNVNPTNLVSAFVPKEKRNPMGFQPQSQGEDLAQGMIEQDVDFEVLKEDFSVYELSNNLILSVKTVVGQISKTKHYTKEGESVYLVNMNPIIKVKKA
ncbi:MAG: hypothetical protein K8Q89_06160 [Nitrosarchaeum sp.]|nr:hypothetical protein [Nitrosarchaeum sp.]